MGTCFQCGQETENQYDYHSADIVSIDSTDDGYGNITTITTYSNFEKHLGYFCNTCANRGKGPVLIVFGTLLALLSVFCVAIIIAFEATEMILIAIFTLIPAVILFYFGANIKKRGKPFPANRGSLVVTRLLSGTFLAGELHRSALGNRREAVKSFKGVEYFTPVAYEVLMKKNGILTTTQKK